MRKPVIVLIIIALVAFYASLFVVQEGERGIVLRFGKVLRDSENKPQVFAPGLHLKFRLSKRLRCWMPVSRPWTTRPIAL